MAKSLDANKPIPTESELLCEGCWEVVDKKKMAQQWRWFNFKYIAPVWLCPKCQEDLSPEMIQKQERGL